MDLTLKERIKIIESSKEEYTSHITSIENLESILRNGLLSELEQEKRGINPKKIIMLNDDPTNIHAFCTMKIFNDFVLYLNPSLKYEKTLGGTTDFEQKKLGPEVNPEEIIGIKTEYPEKALEIQKEVFGEARIPIYYQDSFFREEPKFKISELERFFPK